jgi:hypothetical protein
MQRGLVSLRSGYGGVSYLLAKQLRSLEWLLQGLEVKDVVGRSFHGDTFEGCEKSFGVVLDGAGSQE